MDEIPEDEGKHIPLNCPWTIASKGDSLTIIITCLKRTYDYDFSVQVKAHPQATPNVSKHLELNDCHPLLRSLTHALNLYELFPEPHSKTHQLDVLEDLLEYLDLKFE